MRITDKERTITDSIKDISIDETKMIKYLALYDNAFLYQKTGFIFSEYQREYGFNRDTFEKVLRLRTIPDFLNTHEYMREHLLLKGGTAINLTVFNLPGAAF